MKRLSKFLAAGLVAMVPAIAVSGATSAYADNAPAQPANLAMTPRQVEHLQIALANSGAAIAIDGIWGPKTTVALRAFQKDHGLKVTGWVDQATMKALPKVE